MVHRTPHSIFLLFALLLLTAMQTMAQVKEKTVQKAPIQQTSPASGQEMFKTYCAACHGKDAKGGGPAAAELKTPPPDLTTLATRHDGKFPADYVSNVLRNGAKAPAHGSSEMPVWGPLFASVSGRDPAVVNMRIANLVRYVASLQSK
ncbi:MAG TPA: cytochrome c [Candidatus Acidoferrum sp.]|nr:cytochrome c [Candidatus Acidoferrum sp.]